MYLDTGVVLALIKKDGWLKPFVKWKKIRDPLISAATIIEIELVIGREYGKENVEIFLRKLKELKIKTVPITENIVFKSAGLMARYDLTVFDAVHAACCLSEKEKIVSTDTIFDSVREIERIDLKMV